MAMFIPLNFWNSVLAILSMSCAISLAYSDTKITLELSQVVYRHGDRSPIIGYPKDNYTEADWLSSGAQGYGQLTYDGMRQHYALGQWFRKRYTPDLLDPAYNRSLLFVRSTDVERTLMSAYCNLAGFFPPDEEHAWWPNSSDIHWQPIPVHTVPAELDNLLDVSNSKCPLADDLYNREKETEEFKKKARENKELFESLSHWTGRSHEDLDVLWETVDTLFCEQTHNMTLPDWAAQKWPQPNGTSTVYQWLLDLQTWEFVLRFGEPDQKARLRGGPLLKEMLYNMKRSINRNSPVKFYMYSAHDNTLMAFTHALKVSNNLQPPYAAAVIVELYSVNGTDYGVKVLYRNESNHDPYPMYIPGCKLIEDDLCPYEDFVKLTRSMVPGDLQKECEIPVKKQVDEGYIIGIGVGAGVVFVCIVIVIVVIIKKKKANRPAAYYGINEDA